MSKWKEVHAVTRFGGGSTEIFFELSFILFKFIINCYKFQFLEQLVSCFIVLVLSHLPSIFLNKLPFLEDIINFIIQVFVISFFHLIDYLIVHSMAVIVCESRLLAEACSHTSVDESVQMRVLICFFWVVHLFFNMLIFTLSFGND